MSALNATRPEVAYTTGTGDPVPRDQFTVITADSVFRVKAPSEGRIRTAFANAGIPILGIDRDPREES